MIKDCRKFVALFLLFIVGWSKVYRDRNLLLTTAKPSLRSLKSSRKLTGGVKSLLSAGDIEREAARSRITAYDAREMAINAGQKQQKLTRLLGLVGNFKQTMEDVTSSLSGQISEINSLLSQSRL